MFITYVTTETKLVFGVCECFDELEFWVPEKIQVSLGLFDLLIELIRNGIINRIINITAVPIGIIDV